MRRPSPRCTINTVDLYRASYSQDAAGGRAAAFPSTPTVAGVPCSVQPAVSDTVDRQGKQTLVNTYTIIFHDDPSLTAHDRVVWLGRNLAVKGVVSSAAGRSRSWVVTCEQAT